MPSTRRDLFAALDAVEKVETAHATIMAGGVVLMVER